MRIKDNSVELKLHPELTALLPTLNDYYAEYGDELVITSGSETTAKHGYTSLHYATPGQAIDVRTWERASVPPANIQHEQLTSRVINYARMHKIPADWFEVILESDHIHIEYQPKRPADM